MSERARSVLVSVIGFATVVILTGCGGIRGAARPVLDDAIRAGETAASRVATYEATTSGAAQALRSARRDVAKYVGQAALDTICGVPASVLQEEDVPTLKSSLADFAKDVASDGVAGDAEFVQSLWADVESGKTTKAYAAYKTQVFAAAYCPKIEDSLP